MLTSLGKKIELLANLAIILVACLLATAIVRSYLLSPAASESPSAQRSVAPTVAAFNINWRQNQQTLVLALSNTCRFCTESGPFYQRVAAASPRTRLVAVLPQAREEGRKYLEQLGVPVDEVLQAPLSSMNVNGTPTLLLVNSDGVITNTWIGKLTEAEQAELLKKIL